MFHLFKKNREVVKKYLLIFFLGIVSLGMVITLAPMQSCDPGPGEGNVLASVGGFNITSTELDQTIRDRFKQSPMGFDKRMVPMLAPSVLDQMVLQHALVDQAKTLGVEVSDQELLNTFQHIPWLYPNGNFVGPDRAADMVAQMTGKTLGQFESMLRESLLQEKIRSIVTDGVQVTPAEVLAEFRHRNAKTKIEYVLFDPSQFIKDVKVMPEALEGYFKQNPTRYNLPEQRQARYVLIDPDAVRAQVKVDESELRQYYAQHLSDYRVPDRVKAAHILFKTTDKTPAEIASIEKTAADVLNQIRAGGNFGDLAKKFSEDSTASAGGELGWLVHNQTVPAFETTVFSLKPGEVSGLVKTEYGIHIIKVEDKQVAHLQSFEEVKGPISVEMEKQRVADALEKLAGNLESQMKGDPQQFSEIARKLGLEPKDTPLFKYGQVVPDLGKADAFENLAFQLRLNEVGQPVSVPKGQAIIQVIRIVPAHVPTLDEVRARVEEDYRHDQSVVMAQDKAKKLAEQAKSGDFDKAAKSLGLTPKTSNDFSETEYVEGVGSGSQLTDAFKLAPGQVSGVLSAGTNTVVFKVVSHTPANDADLASQRDQLSEELLDQKRNMAFEIYRGNLKEQLMHSGKLKMNQAGMRSYLAGYMAE